MDFLRQLVIQPANTVAIIEEVGGYIGKAQPASRAFTFGRNFGFLLGVAQTLGVRVELVRPRRWQKVLGVGQASICASTSEWKNRLKAHAQRLFPYLRPTLKTADALLILEYAVQERRKLPKDTQTIAIDAL